MLVRELWVPIPGGINRGMDVALGDTVSAGLGSAGLGWLRTLQECSDTKAPEPQKGREHPRAATLTGLLNHSQSQLSPRCRSSSPTLPRALQAQQPLQPCSGAHGSTLSQQAQLASLPSQQTSGSLEAAKGFSQRYHGLLGVLWSTSHTASGAGAITMALQAGGMVPAALGRGAPEGTYAMNKGAQLNQEPASRGTGLPAEGKK